MSTDNPNYKTVLVSDLIPYARNSRTHSDVQVNKIASSIKEFGFLNPVLIDKDNGIIAGHGRVMAAQKLGLKEVPVLQIGHLSDTQKRAYIIADNRLALDAGWDEEMLRVEFDFLGNDGFKNYMASAVRKATCRACSALRRGSHLVLYRCITSSFFTIFPLWISPPKHSVTSSDVSSRCKPPG